MPISNAIHQKYGTDEGVMFQEAGMYCTYGPNLVYEWVLDLTKLTEVEVVQNDVTVVPQNALIAKIEVEALVGAATGVAIDVGFVHRSQNTSDAEFTADPDGILAAFVTASMDTQGQITTFFPSGTADSEESLPASVTTGGVLIGDITAAPLLLTASRTTSTAFTAGKVAVRVHVRPRALS